MTAAAFLSAPLFPNGLLAVIRASVELMRSTSSAMYASAVASLWSLPP